MPGRVWVVDDNSALAESVVALLTVDKIPARAFFGSAQVLEVLSDDCQPSVMILDISMPDSGNSVLREIMLHPTWTFPVIVMTGYEDLIDKDLRGRVFRVISKTIDPIELLALVRRALG